MCSEAERRRWEYEPAPVALHKPNALGPRTCDEDGNFPRVILPSVVAKKEERQDAKSAKKTEDAVGTEKTKDAKGTVSLGNTAVYTPDKLSGELGTTASSSPDKLLGEIFKSGLRHPRLSSSPHTALTDWGEGDAWASILPPV